MWWIVLWPISLTMAINSQFYRPAHRQTDRAQNRFKTRCAIKCSKTIGCNGFRMTNGQCTLVMEDEKYDMCPKTSDEDSFHHIVPFRKTIGKTAENYEMSDWYPSRCNADKCGNYIVVGISLSTPRGNMIENTCTLPKAPVHLDLSDEETSRTTWGDAMIICPNGVVTAILTNAHAVQSYRCATLINWKQNLNDCVDLEISSIKDTGLQCPEHETKTYFFVGFKINYGMPKPHVGKCCTLKR